MNRPDLIRAMDHPMVNAAIFFPRQDSGTPSPAGSEDLRIQVEPGIKVAARYYPREGESSPTILHFHGNGEIVTDYDNLAPMFHKSGASLISVDYRGYGRSDGTPTARALVEDAHVVLDFVLNMRKERGQSGPLMVMGRSLGSAPAIELAAFRGDDIDGLIVESGFAQSWPLLALFGISREDLSIPAVRLLDNEDKIALVQKPTLLLHAEWDQLLTPWHGKRNFERAGCSQKKLVMIPNADHNTIMMFGGKKYWGELQEWLSRT